MTNRPHERALPGRRGRSGLVPGEHPLPGSLPREDQLPGLSEPRGGRRVREGLGARARSEPHGVDLRFGVRCAVRDGVPAQRGRQAPLDPLREEVPVRLDAPERAGRRPLVHAAARTGVRTAARQGGDHRRGLPVEVGKRVVVLGGGYTAMDCASTSWRLGAEQVYIVYRRSRDEMVVDEEELTETEREGMEFVYLASPVEVLADGKGHVRAV